MPKTISVSEAKNKLSEMLDWTVENQDEVIVASRGQPKAVILPYTAYEALVALRERERRRAALDRMQALAAAVQMRNQDMKPDEAEQLADEIVRDTIDRMSKEGKIAFKPS